ncbi:hypothetical protein PIIN_07422 [Serendipita indica DSM 11827]|uniref:Uncharacterized protein n=1 Tax=Serendipita indica (strain DSM 11827) TaxID=1109443 RepID=G4TQ75_SERID|nr:hypothetical protein PIIN_07422 [Serendipita indica DSM 11827]
MDEASSRQSDEKQPWYRNSWVVAYWEIEDYAMDIYEDALKPLAVLMAVTLCWGLFVCLGSGIVVLGHVLLRTLIFHHEQLTGLSNAQLLYTFRLSILGGLFASFICIPLLELTSRRKLGFFRFSLAYISTAFVLSAYVDSALYLKPVGALAAGAMGGVVCSPLLAAIVLISRRSEPRP